MQHYTLLSKQIYSVKKRLASHFLPARFRANILFVRIISSSEVIKNILHLIMPIYPLPDEYPYGRSPYVAAYTFQHFAHQRVVRFDMHMPGPDDVPPPQEWRFFTLGEPPASGKFPNLIRDLLDAKVTRGGFDDLRGRIYFKLRKKLWFVVNDWALAGQFLDTPLGFLLVTVYGCRQVMRHVKKLLQCTNIGLAQDIKGWLEIIREKFAIWETEVMNEYDLYIEIHGHRGLPDINCQMFNTREMQETRYDGIIRNICLAFGESNGQIE